MKKLKVLDLCCGGGGAALGLIQAGFHEVVGVDIKKQKCYPADHIIADIARLPFDVHAFDAVWVSPPCQRFSPATYSNGGKAAAEKHPNYIPLVRELLDGHPFTVIENVPQAPIRADVRLTGTSVGLGRIDRLRHFETSFFAMYPPVSYLPRWKWEQGIAATITTSMSSSSHYYPRKAIGLSGRIPNWEAKEIMGIPADIKMTNKQIGNAVPPLYAYQIAIQILQQLR